MDPWRRAPTRLGWTVRPLLRNGTPRLDTCWREARTHARRIRAQASCILPRASSAREGSAERAPTGRSSDRTAGVMETHARPVGFVGIPIGLALGTQFRTWSSTFYLGLSWFVAPSVLGPSSSGIAQSAFLGVATGPLLTIDDKITVGGVRNCFTGAASLSSCGWLLVVGSPLLTK